MFTFNLKATQLIELPIITKLQYWQHLIHWVDAHLKRNQETIRVLLKKKKHKETKRNENLLYE